MDLSVGQVVISKAGHDKGDAFIVIALQYDYCLLVDGKRRTLEKPKQKKIKHVQPVNLINADLAKRILSGEYLLDADFAKAIRAFRDKK